MISRKNCRQLWADPSRKIRTLESFSKTEEGGGLDLRAAARRVSDPELVKALTLHADDEVRHAELFRTRARALRAKSGDVAELESSRPYDLARARGGDAADAHGSFTFGLCDELGEVAYVAMLHVAERRAAELFQRHRDALHDDAETRAVFETILKDEKFHVAYTGKTLERWRTAGRASEVKAGLRAARASRFFGAWKRFGARAAASFGRVVLWIFYWTLLVPFSWFASRRRVDSNWRRPVASRERDPLRSQY
ncbi:MAG: ferritin-like domain-containing protein [Planctomycetota bacterium]|nr:ferritin-like domain-containing protein [Planctomycetota bacterium]